MTIVSVLLLRYFGPFAFGTIESMNFRHSQFTRRKTIFWILTVLWAASCASPADLTPASAILLAIPTLTPFQPQPEASVNPYNELMTPQAEPTFTPYPTHYVISDELPTPVEVAPSSSGGGTDFNLLNINNPLTGLPVSDPALLDRRPMVIKIANSPDYVRPQSGLSLADVVFEYYIEWGDTRFIAVFYGNESPLVGPVRSGRYFDEHVARMYNAFLIFKFADPREYSYLKGSTLNDFLVVPGAGTCPPFVAGPYKREIYNNIFFNTTKWAACAAKKSLDNSRQTLRGGFFTEEVPESTLEARRIFSLYSVYNYSYWDYDPATHKYFRYQEANDMVNKKTEAYAALTDAQTGLPVTADNVVVLFVPHTFANQFNAEDQVYNIDLLDFGNAYVFRDGKAIPAYWNRTDENEPLLLTTLTGNPIYLRPGRTFYQVMGTKSTYAQDGADWHFVFQTP